MGLLLLMICLNTIQILLVFIQWNLQLSVIFVEIIKVISCHYAGKFIRDVPVLTAEIVAMKNFLKVAIQAKIENLVMESNV